jgi:hypothetical protein
MPLETLETGRPLRCDRIQLLYTMASETYAESGSCHLWPLSLLTRSGPIADI